MGVLSDRRGQAPSNNFWRFSRIPLCLVVAVLTFDVTPVVNGQADEHAFRRALPGYFYRFPAIVDCGVAHSHFFYQQAKQKLDGNRVLRDQHMPTERLERCGSTTTPLLITSPSCNHSCWKLSCSSDS